MFKFQFYKRLLSSKDRIYADAEKAADELGISPDIRGTFGLSGAISGCPALLRKDVMKAMHEAGRKVVGNKTLDEQVRELVKSYYGDEYDAVAINTCEAGLWVAYDCLATPPIAGRGTQYRARYIAPYERHVHHQASYGRPFPPKYRDICSDRGVTSGELGFYGKRLENLDVVLVPLEGARYECHGIKYHPAVLLSGVNAEASADRIRCTAERHAPYLTAMASLGYDLPSYGYGDKDGDGVPVLMKRIGQVAEDYNVPYIIDNALGAPFNGVDIRDVGGDVMVYSMDKVAGAPTVGLAIGKENPMVSMRRALGVAPDRSGEPAFGKAAYVTNDPGKEALVGLIAALKALLERPRLIPDTVDALEAIVKEEFEALPESLRAGLAISKSYNCASVEVNYEQTWKDGFGIPIFTMEDMYAGTALIQTGLARMGVIPMISYDANLLITPGLGTIDEDGILIEDRMRLAVRALVRMVQIVCEHSGLI